MCLAVRLFASRKICQAQWIHGLNYECNERWYRRCPHTASGCSPPKSNDIAFNTWKWISTRKCFSVTGCSVRVTIPLHLTPSFTMTSLHDGYQGWLDMLKLLRILRSLSFFPGRGDSRYTQILLGPAYIYIFHNIWYRFNIISYTSIKFPGKTINFPST